MSARVINKLILFVSEACNLKCRYCYVMLPGACQKAMMMSEDTARRIARQIFAQNGSCGFVQFFGGEPTLNMPALRAFVAEVFRIGNEGSGVRLPQFGLVTNGASRHVRELEDFCREYRIGVTVSLDGFKSIHDALRPSAKGTGSFDDAVMTIESLLRAQVPVAIETVYTSLHIDRQCSIVDLFKLTQDLGVRKLVFHTAYPPAPAELCPFDDAHFDRLKNYHIEAVDAWFASLISESPNHLDVYFKDLLVPLLQGGGASVAGGGCPAGNIDYALAPDGSVYSCHLLYGNPQFYLGNILSEEPLLFEQALPKHVRDLPQCSDCYARYWCQPCGALNLGWGDAWVPPERECALRRAVLLRIGEWAFKHLSIPENSLTDVLRQAVQYGGKAQPDARCGVFSARGAAAKTASLPS